MKLLIKIAALLLSTAVSLSAAADLPRVVFISVSGLEPAAEDVVTIFEEHLLELDIEVETTAYDLEKAPRGPAGWMREAKGLSRQPADWSREGEADRSR